MDIHSNTDIRVRYFIYDNDLSFYGTCSCFPITADVNENIIDEQTGNLFEVGSFRAITKPAQ